VILTHFSTKNWKLDRLWFYMQAGHFKPRGLWLSDESDYGWKEWCESERFHLGYLASATQFTLSENANIIHLTNIDEVMEFQKQWQRPEEGVYYREIDWGAIAAKYDGILITPYRKDWTTHLPSWYLGWDVSSGCFWNLDILQEVQVDQLMLEEREKVDG